MNHDLRLVPSLSAAAAALLAVQIGTTGAGCDGVEDGGPGRLRTVPSADSSWLPAPEVPRPRAFFVPGDLTTGVGESLPEVRFEVYRDPIVGALLSALADATSLRTWPELVPVPADIVAAAADAAGSQTISIRLPSLLDDRWYALVVTSLPPGLEWARYARQFVLADGSTAVRFRTGSQPMLTRIEVCDHGSGYLVVIGFSEPMIATRSLDEIVSIEQVGLASGACRAGGTLPEGARGVEYVCPPLDTTASTVVRVEEGLRSASGAALSGSLLQPPPLRVAFRIEELAVVGNGCGFWQP